MEIKNGSVDVNNIDTYNELKKKLEFVRARLNCVTSPRFKKEYFIIGDYDSGTNENKDYIMLAANRSQTDEKLKQELIDFLTTKFIEQMNKVITQMNDLIKRGITMAVEKLIYGHEDYLVPVNIVSKIPDGRIAVGLNSSSATVYFVTDYEIDMVSKTIEYKWQPVHRLDTQHGMKNEWFMTLEEAYKKFDTIYLLHSWADFKNIPDIGLYQ